MMPNAPTGPIGHSTPATSYVVTHEAAATAGTISYWRLSGAVSLEHLTQAWRAHNLNPKLLPHAPSDETALSRAVKEEAAKRILVRPLARRGAWAIVRETTSAEIILSYTTLLTVQATPAGVVYTQEGAIPAEHAEIVARITDNCTKHHGELAPEDIGTWLVKLAYDNSGVALRDTGGIYFVPRQHTAFWGQVVAAIESVSGHRVFRIPAMKNSEAIDAITDAVTQEAEMIVRQMESELQGLGDRALATRRKACEELLAKVSAYDALLGVQLKCRTRVEELQAAIAMAALVSGADPA